MKTVVITGSGLCTPPHSISNDELVAAFNEYVAAWNDAHREEIAAGDLEPLRPSSSEFIEKASGIKSRYVMNKSGILDPEILAPRLVERTNGDPSFQCEIGVEAAREALDQAGRTPADIDCVVVACSDFQRPYPAISIEIQERLGIAGFAYDLNVACSSASFGIQNGYDAIRNGSARAVLVVSPEICSGWLDYRDRDSHFIFGDAATAVVMEAEEDAEADERWEILGTKMQTVFSNNIRNNHGFLNRTHPESRDEPDKLFKQQGRKVFKEVVPIVTDLIRAHLEELGIAPDQLDRVWLHQANENMNSLIVRRLFQREPDPVQVPSVLDEYANTSSAGAIIVFHKFRDDLGSGDLGAICSFGAGYSVGNVVVRRV